MTEFKKGDRVKVTAEGVVDADDHLGWVILLDVKSDRTSSPPRMRISKRSTAVVEKVDRVWEWRDGDVIQSPAGRESLNRRLGWWEWWDGDGRRYTDGAVTRLVNHLGWRVLRYQAGENNE